MLYGEVKITKAENGWLLEHSVEGSPSSIYVYEIGCEDYGEQRAIQRLFQDLAESYLQTKRGGGLTIKLEEKGYDED
jgi:hypothetical protein